jgi:16S rRNA (uracil1498-N3)-methyltransferase
MFLVEALPAGDEFTLDGPEGHHAATVQRLRVGEVLTLSDGQGGAATAVVTATGRGALELRIQQRRYEPAADPRFIVAQGIAKGERGELAVQAMTEVGVDVIIPWPASRSVVRWHDERGERSHQRWVDTAREAAKQARRAWLPVVAKPEPTSLVTARAAGAAQILILHEAAASSLATVALPASGDILLVVGPEGGIASDELASFLAVGGVPVRLGPQVLRTSTAGVAALAVLSVRAGRW